LQGQGGALELNRQEIIALVNTLNQLSTSVEFSTTVQQQRSAGHSDRAIVDFLTSRYYAAEEGMGMGSGSGKQGQGKEGVGGVAMGSSGLFEALLALWLWLAQLAIEAVGVPAALLASLLCLPLVSAWWLFRSRAAVAREAS
jgi:hypothetical protein